MSEKMGHKPPRNGNRQMSLTRKDQKNEKNFRKGLDKTRGICYNMRCEYNWGIAKR